ncbi:MAG: tripartite tricarboxylate transporter substrate binding protein [Pseudomonadota bacterium]
MQSSTPMSRRAAAGLLLAAGCALAGTTALAADPYPNKLITLVVPFAPGGNLDVVARAAAPVLQKQLGQTVIVDNRAGAGGAIGAAYVARAEPDGYTLLVTTPNAIVVLPRMAKTQYKLADFRSVGLLATTSQVIVVPANSRFKDIKALLAEARANPGKLSAAHSGLGTTNQVGILQLEDAARISLNAVPYKGSGPALVDLIGGQLDMMVDQLSSSAPHIASGAIRVLAVMGRERDPTLPNVPTLREAGLKDFDSSTATGIIAPAATPRAVVDTLNAAIRKALADEDVRQRLAKIGSPAHPSTVDEWQQQLDREEAGAAALAKSGKLKAE